MKNLSISKKFKHTSIKLSLSVSKNDKVYLSIKTIDNKTLESSSIGIPFSQREAGRIYTWLAECLFPYSLKYGDEFGNLDD